MSVEAKGEIPKLKISKKLQKLLRAQIDFFADTAMIKLCEESKLEETKKRCQLHKDILIQYGRFDLSRKNAESGGIYFNSSFTDIVNPEAEEPNNIHPNNTSDEGIYEIDDAKESTIGTKIKISSWKSCFDSFTITKKLDFRGKSDDKCIYTIDLFPDFVPKDYDATLWTRGGFTGWNWFNKSSHMALVMEALLNS
ncbi:MAG: GNAT family N-acetyltransferase [Edafosvirus sp.]|uniref:GNAT family N-acetyltransferase n=1 Tax=Edafosvirus sp. TaxID=2487765 RepID=A0A3G4ZUN8_9VIRU|nr:MAG: GNAT family N-acetyltransferase [Edafosvirus sp.]